MATASWIKNIDFSKELDIDKFTLYEKFKRVASIVKDDILDENGEKKRNTLIQFIPDDKHEWSINNEWIYIFTIDDKIVKIGGTRTSLKNRSASYLCGHHTPDRGKSGKCSITNAYIYNTFNFYLDNGHRIEMYAYKIPKHIVSIKIIDEMVDIHAQLYHAFESKFLKEYKKLTSYFPSLNDNADPNYT